MEAYLGIDVGSVTTKPAGLDKDDELIATLYLPTQGKPIEMVQQGLKQIKDQLPKEVEIRGVANTGNNRYLAGVIVGADLVKNEITSHALEPKQTIRTENLVLPPLIIDGRIRISGEFDIRHLLDAIEAEMETKKR